MDDILNRARVSFRNAAKLPYPKGLEVSQWWAERQAMSLNAIEMFETAQGAIDRAQSKASFDHREFDQRRLTQVINFKVNELKLRFPGFDLKDLPEESKLSSAVVEVEGRNISSIFLTHLYFYLRTQEFIKLNKARILEIGSGYGALARIFKIMRPFSTYVLIDLPESLFYAQIFIESNFPNAKIFYVENSVPDNLDDYDFIFCPAQNAPLLKGQSFDLTLNTGSLQEMPTQAVLFWMDFIQETIDTKLFYSWNYFLNDKEKCPEANGASFICPILDPYWIPAYFRINEPIITLDCNQRNWLEVLVERIPRDQHQSLDRLAYANALIDNANNCYVCTNQWFSNVWMAFWVNQEEKIIDAIIHGINQFAKGHALGIQNYLPSTTEFNEIQFYSKVRVQAERQAPPSQPS